MAAAVSESHCQQTRHSWGYRFDSILGYPLNIRLSKLDIYSSLYINQTYAWMWLSEPLLVSSLLQVLEIFSLLALTI
jgi:hypothetical protein